MDIMSYLLGSNSAIKKGLKVQVVEELPTIGEENVLYLVPKQNTGQSDVFEEWIYINNNWEKIGSTDIDLSNYYTKDETIAKLTSMPTASADYLGTVVLYIGTTTSSYTNGRFYIGISTGEPATYSWSEMTVQDLTNYYTQTQVNNITGSLSDLSTTAKTNLVSAINELAGNSSPVKVVDLGTVVSSITEVYTTSQALKNLRGEGNYGCYLVKATYTNSNFAGEQYAGYLVCSPSGNYTLQELELFKEKNTAGGMYNNIRSYTHRKIQNSNGNVYGNDFNNNILYLPALDVNYNINQGIRTDSITRGKDLTKWYGSKIITNLTTTNKDSLVDAINEVNTGLGNTVKTSGNQTIAGTKTFSTLPQSSGTPSNNNDLVNKTYVDGLVGNINTVLATLTTPSNGGA